MDDAVASKRRRARRRAITAMVVCAAAGASFLCAAPDGSSTAPTLGSIARAQSAEGGGTTEREETVEQETSGVEETSDAQTGAAASGEKNASERTEGGQSGAKGGAKKSEDAKESEPEPRALGADDISVEIHKPDGWVRGRRPRDTVALLRAAGAEVKAQIELKATEGLTPRQAAIFFQSFRVRLLRSGVSWESTRKKQTYGDRTGQEAEYSLLSQETRYRLVVWQYHAGQIAYLFVGFFPEAQRDNFYEAFQEVVSRSELPD